MVAIKATMRLGFLVVKDDAFAAFKNGVPAMGELDVESVAGTTGNTVITVSPKPIGGHKLVYKTAASTAPSVAYDDDLSNGQSLTTVMKLLRQTVTRLQLRKLPQTAKRESRAVPTF